VRDLLRAARPSYQPRARSSNEEASSHSNFDKAGRSCSSPQYASHVETVGKLYACGMP